MKSKPIKKRKDGEWFPVSKDGHRIKCCDCGLEHFVHIKVTKTGRLYMAAWRLDE